MKSDKVVISSKYAVEGVLKAFYQKKGEDEPTEAPWPWGEIHIFDATVTFPGDSMVRVRGKLRLYRWWHPWHHPLETAPKGATWEEHQRAWYNPARWFEGKIRYELTSGVSAYHYIRSVDVDIVVPATLVTFTPKEEKGSTSEAIA